MDKKITLKMIRRLMTKSTPLEDNHIFTIPILKPKQVKHRSLRKVYAENVQK